jgi:hypothetical protein
MNDFDQKSFDLWLQANSPGGAALGIWTPPKAIVASFIAGASSGNPVVSNGNLVGSQAQEALRLDAAYAKAPPPEAVPRLQESPATGCTMLLTLARQKSGYNPAIPAQAGSTQKFLDYLQQVLVCPLFMAILNEHLNPQFSGDWNNVINQILGYYPKMPPADLQVLRDGLYRIAAAASSNPSTDQTLDMFSQTTLSVDADIDVYMYQTHVKMTTSVSHGGKHEPDRVSNQTQMDLYRVQLRFRASQWPAQAATVHEQTQDSLADWLATNSTPAGPLATGWRPRLDLDR